MVDQETVKTNRRGELVAILITTLVMLGIYAVMSSRFVQDTLKGWGFAESTVVGEIRADLELTETGERIFLATQPAVEQAEAFNEHCDSHRQEVSLLGCYTNDRIYIYEIQKELLEDSNKVTAAHELLHAVWMRMGWSERKAVEALLRQVQDERPEWVEEELSLYGENERMEELYARVGTKLRDLPEELEEHYRKYFANRAKIVAFYENYQAPFNRLKEANEGLRVEVMELSRRIGTEKAKYEVDLAALEGVVERFNECAETEGCFRSQEEFTEKRENIERERERLDAWREEINAEVDRNNELIAEYDENQRILGELNDALNSNVEKIE